MALKITDPLALLLRNFVSRTTKEMKAILANKGKRNTNIFHIMTYFKVTTKGNNFSVETKLPDYAIYVDKGRRPGKRPPLRAIVQWMKEKKINKPIGFAYYVQKKIGEEGIPATNFTRPMKDLNALIVEMKKEFSKIVLEEVKEIKNNFKAK